MNAATEALVMLIAGIFIKDKEISVNTMILLQCIMLFAEIVTDYGYYKLLYIPCKEKVFDMWKTENK